MVPIGVNVQFLLDPSALLWAGRLKLAIDPSRQLLLLSGANVAILILALARFRQLVVATRADRLPRWAHPLQLALVLTSAVCAVVPLVELAARAACGLWEEDRLFEVLTS